MTPNYHYYNPSLQYRSKMHCGIGHPNRIHLQAAHVPPRRILPPMTSFWSQHLPDENLQPQSPVEALLSAVFACRRHLPSRIHPCRRERRDTTPSVKQRGDLAMAMRKVGSEGAFPGQKKGCRPRC